MTVKGITKERFIYLDFIKVLAIYFVCLYHYSSLDINILANPSKLTYASYFIKGIASTGVPLFFMVNGALMLNRKYDLKKHTKKTINIIFLTIIWGIITLIILAPIKDKTYTLPQFIYALWFWEGGTINHLWFLQALVCVYFLYPLTKEIYDKEDKSVLKYFLIIVFIFTFGNVILNMIINIMNSILGTNYVGINRVNLFNNFNVFRGFYAYTIVYFILGAIILKKLTTNLEINLKQMIALFFIGITTLFLYGIMMSKLGSQTYDTVWNGYDTVMTLITCISIFGLSFLAKDKINRAAGIIQLIGENTLGIYFIHRFVGEILRPYYVTLPFCRDILPNLVFSLMVMLISLIITLILKRIPLVNRLFKI